MIDLIKQKIIDNISDHRDLKTSDLSVLKYCTPASGINPGGKVIFLIFKNDADNPLFCVKTVRKNNDSHVIINAYSNLLNLYGLVVNSGYEKMFPKPIFLSENNQGIIFSVETVCVGRKPSINDYKLIVDSYVKFQAYLVDAFGSVSIDAGHYFEKIISRLNLSELDNQMIKKYFQDNFYASDKDICVVPQHGDLTLDNILIGNDEVKIFDCERFGLINIAGFDLFHFLQKRKVANFIGDNYEMFRDYFSSIGCKSELNPLLIFLYCLNEIELKFIPLTGKIDFDFIVNNFEKSI